MEQPLIVPAPSPGVLIQGGAAPVPGTFDAVSVRIDSYDIARAVAVIGMLLVNYYVIFLESFEGDSLFADLANLICGRAAALFIILAGVGLTLLGRKALSSGDPSLLSSYRRQVIKRCIILYIMGHLFWFHWRADILHFYGLFLIVGALMIDCKSKVLWRVNLLIFCVSIIVFWITEGEPDISPILTFKGVLLNTGSDLLFSGHYACFPWFTFLLSGIWFAKNRMLASKASRVKVLVVSLVVLFVTEVLIYIGEWYVWPDDGEPVYLMFWRSAFPMSPLHLLSSGASAFILLIMIIWACDKPRLLKLLWPLRAMGRLSLTIYVSHIFLAYAMYDLMDGEPDEERYIHMVTLFYAASCMLYISFANIWCSYFKYGPLEWIMRSAVKFQKNSGAVLE